MDLDHPRQVGALDQDDMLAHITRLPTLCEQAWALAQAVELPRSYGAPRQIIVSGMGGSAIGGALLQGLALEECAVPITVIRGYSLPAYVQGPDCLVIASSYSGNTEETLSAVHEALNRNARVLAVTTGGQIADMAQSRGFPAVRYNYHSQPRAALPFPFLLLAGVLWKLGLLNDLSTDVGEAVRVMRDWQTEIQPEVPSSGNQAKALAQRLAGRLPVIYGAGFLAPVANRWKTQFNENAKHWAISEEMPELNHNAVVGYGHPLAVRDEALVVMLRSSLDHARIQARWDVTRELLERESVASETLHSRGSSRLAQMLSLVLFGDYVSYYLALLNDADPTPIGPIAFLKRRMAEMG